MSRTYKDSPKRVTTNGKKKTHRAGSVRAARRAPEDFRNVARAAIVLAQAEALAERTETLDTSPTQEGQRHAD